MKKSIQSMMVILVLLAMMTVNTFAATPIVGWTADLSVTANWQTEGKEGGGLDFVSLSAPDAERYIIVSKYGTLGGFKAKIVDNNDTPWKAIATQVTIDLDQTQYLHIKHSEVNAVYCIKATAEQNPTDGQDMILLPEGSSKGQELVVDIKTKTGWSGKKTFWIKYFIIDAEKISKDNVAELFCITSSMAFVQAPASSSASSSKVVSTSSASKSVSSVSTAVSTSTSVLSQSKDSSSVKSSSEVKSNSLSTSSEVDEKNGIPAGTIAIIVVAALAVAGATTFFIIKKKKKS